jgi:hypothetical protein
LDKAGYNDLSVQHFGSSQDVLVRLPLTADQNTASIGQAVIEALAVEAPGATLRRVEFVGPQVGRELAENGALALLVVIIGIVLYLSFRFEWRFSISAIIANLHDVIIILGFFAFFQWEFSLSVLAAVLAVLGYSVNESVVVFDRVRETFKKTRGLSTSDSPRPRNHQHHLADHHHARVDADHGPVDAGLRRRDAVLLRPGADHRHLLRHLLVGAGRQSAGDVARRLTRAVRQAEKADPEGANEDGAVV